MSEHTTEGCDACGVARKGQSRRADRANEWAVSVRLNDGKMQWWYSGGCEPDVRCRVDPAVGLVIAGPCSSARGNDWRAG
jgi:hypothetical protein